MTEVSFQNTFIMQMPPVFTENLQGAQNYNIHWEREGDLSLGEDSLILA